MAQKQGNSLNAAERKAAERSAREQAEARLKVSAAEEELTVALAAVSAAIEAEEAVEAARQSEFERMKHEKMIAGLEKAAHSDTMARIKEARRSRKAVEPVVEGPSSEPPRNTLALISAKRTEEEAFKGDSGRQETKRRIIERRNRFKEEGR